MRMLLIVSLLLCYLSGPCYSGQVNEQKKVAGRNYRKISTFLATDIIREGRISLARQLANAAKEELAHLSNDVCSECYIGYCETCRKNSEGCLLLNASMCNVCTSLDSQLHLASCNLTGKSREVPGLDRVLKEIKGRIQFDSRKRREECLNCTLGINGVKHVEEDSDDNEVRMMRFAPVPVRKHCKEQ